MSRKITNIKPLADLLLVRPDKADSVTNSGIFMGEDKKAIYQESEVLAVGPGMKDMNGKEMSIDVKVGDTVLTVKNNNPGMDFDGEKVMLVKEQEVLAILTSEVIKYDH